jgi:hypothetical protein
MMADLWVWSEHIEKQIHERELSREIILSVINDPDQIVSGRLGRQVYQKIIGNKLIRVVVDGNVLVTVYATTRIDKYMRGTQE